MYCNHVVEKSDFDEEHEKAEANWRKQGDAAAQKCNAAIQTGPPSKHPVLMDKNMNTWHCMQDVICDTAEVY